MNTKIIKLLCITTAFLAGAAFMVSCSKGPEAKVGKKGKKAAAAQVIVPDEKNTLTAIRNGQLVSLNWRVDAEALTGGKLKNVFVLRSRTDKGGKIKVAELRPGATSHQDILPNEYAYWYWIRLQREDGKFMEIGPVKVDIDKAGPAAYAKQEDKYKIRITRTDDFATLTWDFPEAEYKAIDIVRYQRPVLEPFKANTKGRKSVKSTPEGKSQCTDALQEPNSEYWYWFRITLKSGPVVHRGPIKAEYAGR